MSSKAIFHQADLTRAVKGCQNAGMTIGTVRISPSGEIMVYAAGALPVQRDNPLDRLFDIDP